MTIETDNEEITLPARRISEMDLDLWRDGMAIAPDAFDWVRITGITERRRSLDVTLAVRASACAEITAGLAPGEKLVDAVVDILGELAHEVIEDDMLREELLELPEASAEQQADPLTSMVIWSISEAGTLLAAAAQVSQEAGPIRIGRVGPLGEDVTLAVTLPPVLHAEMRAQLGDREGDDSRSAAVSEVIMAAYAAFHRALRDNAHGDDIPF
ncbi:MAG: hypothetical protein EBS23_00800 [Betaproteobacteria bacterium]|nr:hypothetical protein [Betaproteobacteria bacterium]